MTSRRAITLLLALVAGGTIACDELLPTAGEESLLPFVPTTFEVILPFSEFVDSVRQYPGFGTITGLATAIAARDFDGGLTSNAVFRFTPIIDRLFFVDSMGASRLDSLYTIVGGRVIVPVDTALSESTGVDVEVFAGSMQTPWNPRTASWDFAVDTINNRTPWGEPGGGPVVPLASDIFSPADTSALVFEIDSLQANILARGDDPANGLLLQVLTEGAKLEFTAGAIFEVDVRPSFRPELTVVEPLELDFLSLLYEEPPEDPDGYRVGGAPSRRTVFFMDIPDSVDAPDAACGDPPCRVPVIPATVGFAELLLSVVPGTPGFTPAVPIPLDAREVLAPVLLPEAPLGSSLAAPGGSLVVPNAQPLETDRGRNFTLVLTNFIQARVAVADPEAPRPANLALLTALEPFVLDMVTFEAGGTDREPLLRLVITPRQEIRFR